MTDTFLEILQTLVWPLVSLSGTVKEAAFLWSHWITPPHFLFLLLLMLDRRLKTEVTTFQPCAHCFSGLLP